MGLDGVELIMAIEEKFGVEIPDAEAQEIRTTRDFCNLIARKVRTVDSTACLTQKAFYLIRRVLRAERPIPRRMFRPETQLDILISRNRIQEWQRLRDAMGAIEWPKLKFRRGVASAMAISIFIGFLLAWWKMTAALAPNFLTAFFAASLITSAFAYVLLATFRPMKTSLAGQTVGSLSEFIVASNVHLVAPQAADWTAERIRAVVRAVVVEQLGIEPNFSDDAEFVKDLGVD